MSKNSRTGPALRASASEIRRFIRRLSPMENRLFTAMAEDNPPFIQRIIRTILDDDSLVVTSVTVEHVFSASRTLDGQDAHGARVDVLARDENGDNYCIEVQCYEDDIAHRGAFYLAHMFTRMLEPGSQYTDIRKACVIWIVDEDIFDKGQVLYRFSGMYDPYAGLHISNGMHMIVFNAALAGQKEPESPLGKLGSDFMATNSQMMCYDEFRKTYHKITETPEGEVKMGRVFKEFEELCVARGRESGLAEGFAEGRTEGRAEGRTEGRAEGLVEGRAEGKDEQTEQIVTNMLRDGLPHETIARYCGTSDATITAIEQRLRAAGGPS